MRAVLFDVTKCVGCGSCVAACREKNGLPETEAADLTAQQFTVVKTTSSKDGTQFNYRRMCMHCVEPACASACPVGALHKTANGPVVYDADICLGCRYCVQACAFGVPRFEWFSLTPRVRKCSFCADRLAAGRINACAEACPTGATLAGERDQLLAEAHARIKAAQDTYIQKVFGEHEAGGTGVLYVSPVDFAQLGLPANLPGEPLPQFTYRALSTIPAVVGMGGFMLAGLWWLTNRKADVARVEGGSR